MGLTLEVGILADLGENDPEAAELYRESFDQLNVYLQSLGMEPHREPSGGEVWSADMPGYSGLHQLRRIAAHADLTGKLPPAGVRGGSKDSLVDRYFSQALGMGGGLFSWLANRGRRFAREFDHLIVHGDAEGFYLPADFAEVLLPPPEFRVPGGMVGSAPRLSEELSRLATLLEIPASLTPESDELFDVMEHPWEEGDLWRRYGVESYSCVVLQEGCRRCIATGAALAFV